MRGRSIFTHPRATPIPNHIASNLKALGTRTTSSAKFKIIETWSDAVSENV